MSAERIDLAGLQIASSEAVEPGDVWIGPSGPGLSPRLIEAFARGEVTEGGMAEAGWRHVGRIVGDGPSIKRHNPT